MPNKETVDDHLEDLPISGSPVGEPFPDVAKKVKEPLGKEFNTFIVETGLDARETTSGQKK